MIDGSEKRGFSLVEVLTAIAVVAVLAGLLLGVGKRIRTQANENLTKSEIEIINTALEQYYEFYNQFPFNTDEDFEPTLTDSDYATDGYLEADLQDDMEQALGESITFNGDHSELYCSSEALYFFLSRGVNSKKLVGTISASLLTSKGADDLPLTYTNSATGDDFDLVRFVDAWGRELRYTYPANSSGEPLGQFPLITSAGADGKFETEGDNLNNR